jgi:quercetin dioxygenase-like cupin family protein
MWNRPYVPRLQPQAHRWRTFEGFAPDLPLGGEVTVLSADPEDGASSCLWRIPAGFNSAGGHVLSGGEQLFVLEGSFTKGDHLYTEGCYGYRAPRTRHEPLSSDDGALVLAFWDSELRPSPRPFQRQGPSGDGAIFVDTNSMDYKVHDVPGPAEGIVVKLLNREAATGGSTMIVTIGGGWDEHRAEHHDCVEESYKLAGDIRIVENGHEHILSAGDYFFRPPRIKHGPMNTERGTSSLIRFSGELVNHYGPLDP